MAGEEGFEPSNADSKDPCLAAWRLPNELRCRMPDTRCQIPDAGSVHHDPPSGIWHPASALSPSRTAYSLRGTKRVTVAVGNSTATAS